MKLRTFADEASWIEAAVAEFRQSLEAARESGRSLEAILAGGKSPEPLYLALASLRLRYLPVRLWLGDERDVPPSDPARNGILLSRSFSNANWDPLPDVRPWPALPAPEAAARYEAEILSALRGLPVFDLAFLGIGVDGHSAGIFPGDTAAKAFAESERLAVATTAPSEPRGRMTLTPACIARSRKIRFLTRGTAKGAMLEELTGGAGRALVAGRLAELAETLGSSVEILHCEAD
jgi:6-phosphogluconolactonase